MMRSLFKASREAVRAMWPRSRVWQVLLGSLLLAALPVLAGLAVLVFWTLPVRGHRDLAAPQPGSARGVSYFHDEVPQVPWSIHVVKINRARADFSIEAVLGHGTAIGMATVSEQIEVLPPHWGRPVAAVNGDLFFNHHNYVGDPEGLHIMHGELVSGPSPERVCTWIDAAGQPHRGKVESRFAVTWPDGRTTPFGLNEAREPDAAVLYTTAVGRSTRARGGRELLLERADDSSWLPLQPGRTYTARVRKISRTGDTPLQPDVMVLSLGPELLGQVPSVAPGDTLKISTDTQPPLVGARMAIGGGPTLVAGGRPNEWTGLRLRHPRTAIGWNKDYFFLVVVDGRQVHLSLGMTLPELANYMVKLGCEEAMNLDGGGSATCWVYGQVMNNPSEGRERPAANAVVVLKKTPRPQSPSGVARSRATESPPTSNP